MVPIYQQNQHTVLIYQQNQHMVPIYQQNITPSPYTSRTNTRSPYTSRTSHCPRMPAEPTYGPHIPAEYHIVPVYQTEKEHPTSRLILTSKSTLSPSGILGTVGLRRDDRSGRCLHVWESFQHVSNQTLHNDLIS